MNQDSASLTRSNAFAIWVSTPSWIAPEKYRGEAISSAKDEVPWLNNSWNIRYWLLQRMMRLKLS